jgi:hypothetical protein
MKPNSLRALALAVALGLSLGACAKLPSSSEVKVGSDIQGGLTADYLYYSPSGPSDGSGQQEIINGFLNAATGPQNDYQVAREFLTGSLAPKWNPGKELLIGDARPEVRLIGTLAAQLTVNAVARIDELGRYHDLGVGIKRVLNFTFAKEDGQWRVSEAPDATVLVRPVFDVLFKSYALYFYDKQNRYLVPDLRWYASRVSTSTRLVSNLLDGPDTWLASAVNTAFPPQTKLAIDSVTVQDGVAIVDLASSANKATIIQRQRMLAQLTATLTQLANVNSVEIRIDHIAQNITNLPYEVSLANNPDPIVLTKTGFKALSTTAVSMQKATAAATRWGATDFGINNQQTLLALKSRQGVGLFHLTSIDSTITPIDARPGLLAPVIDPQGYVWSLGAGKDSTLQAFDSAGHQKFVSLGWLNGKTHKAFALSREGGRIAVLLSTDTGNHLYIASIQRDSTGMPVSISDPVEIGQTQRIVRSISWIDDTNVATVALADGGYTYPLYLQVGGEVRKYAPVVNAVSVVANSTYSNAYVLDNVNQLRVLRSMTWIEYLQDVLAIHFAG